MDTIELVNEQTRMIIDPIGAWITNLSDANGDILFPRRKLRAGDGSVKIRGGCHVCLPNFGPGGKSGLPQHGFGRTMVWDADVQSASVVELGLRHGGDGYKSLQSVVRYELEPDRLNIRLRVANGGDKRLRIAPAFHPYFMTEKNAEKVTISNVLYDLSDMAEAQFASGTERTIAANGRVYTLTSDELPIWAYWTDQLGPYVCVEPTVDGFSFLNDTPSEKEWLAPGESRTYLLVIRWQ